jgi:hypothetical protein
LKQPVTYWLLVLATGHFFGYWYWQLATFSGYWYWQLATFFWSLVLATGDFPPIAKPTH